MRTYIIDNGSGFLPKLQKLLSDYQPAVLKHSSLYEQNIRPDDFVVLSGGSLKPVYSNDHYYRQELDLIRSHPGPLIGICLGFQMIAYAYGSDIFRHKERRQGKAWIKPIPGNDLLPEAQALSVYTSNRWSVCQVYPPLISLATSEQGIEIVKHTGRPMYGLQFHPESSVSTDGRTVWRSILRSLHI